MIRQPFRSLKGSILLTSSTPLKKPFFHVQKASFLKSLGFVDEMFYKLTKLCQKCKYSDLSGTYIVLKGRNLEERSEMRNELA